MSQGDEVRVGRMRPKTIGLVVSAAAILGMGVALLVFLSDRDLHDPATPDPDAIVVNGSVPQQAAQSVRDMVGGGAEQARAALSPTLAELVRSDGLPFTAGTTFELDSGTWQRDGLFASATGMLAEPGQPPRRMVVGFVLIDGRWRITMLERIS